jgi:hypothetical protein
MSLATYHVGDVFDVLGTMPDGSVDLVLTSPPFLALRSDLPDDHPDKGKEIGQEPTPAEFLDTLLALTAEWGRVLAPHGSIAVELGDSYSGGVGLVQSREHRPERDGTGADGGARVVPLKEGDDWPLAKSICIVPALYAACLAYGRNVLTGEESPAGMWRVRNLVRWVRPNPPVGALGDKFRPATSVIVIATRSRTRWFDLDAVRTESKNPDDMGRMNKGGYQAGVGSGIDGVSLKRNSPDNPAGAPPLDWWEVSPEAYKGSHYATWPRKLLVRPVLAMCPQHVCRTCGEPRRRMVERERTFENVTEYAGRSTAATNGGAFGNSFTVTRSTTGWTDCGHDDYRRGIVLDPFAGSGTTLAVANGLGRDAVGIDLDARNADLARERCGMFLEVVER